jgi:predicted Zn-dependent protease
MEKATGMPVTELEAAVTRYLRGSFKSTRQARRPKTFPAVVTDLPASADDLLLESQQLKRLSDEDKAPALLAKVRRAAAKHAGDRFAELTLARAETQLGDRAKGEAILKRLLASEPDDVESLLVLARSRMAEGDGKDAKGKRAAYAEARRHLETAFKKDAERYDTLIAYLQSRSTEPQTENDFEVLKAAYFAAPQVATIRMRLGQVLMARRQYGHAATVLEPLANNPHGGEVVAAAKALVEEARGKAAPASAAAK